MSGYTRRPTSIVDPGERRYLKLVVQPSPSQRRGRRGPRLSVERYTSRFRPTEAGLRGESPCVATGNSAVCGFDGDAFWNPRLDCKLRYLADVEVWIVAVLNDPRT